MPSPSALRCSCSHRPGPESEAGRRAGTGVKIEAGGARRRRDAPGGRPAASPLPLPSALVLCPPRTPRSPPSPSLPLPHNPSSPLSPPSPSSPSSSRPARPSSPLPPVPARSAQHGCHSGHRRERRSESLSAGSFPIRLRGGSAGVGRRHQNRLSFSCPRGFSTENIYVLKALPAGSEVGGD